MSSLAATKASPRKRNAAPAQLEPETIAVDRGPLEPETISADRNDRIREIAYFLWIEEGYPEGQSERHWLAAETLVDSDPVERKRIEGEPPGEPVGASSTARDLRGARAI